MLHDTLSRGLGAGRRLPLSPCLGLGLAPATLKTASRIGGAATKPSCRRCRLAVSFDGHARPPPQKLDGGQRHSVRCSCDSGGVTAELGDNVGLGGDQVSADPAGGEDPLQHGHPVSVWCGGGPARPVRQKWAVGAVPPLNGLVYGDLQALLIMNAAPRTGGPAARPGGLATQACTEEGPQNAAPRNLWSPVRTWVTMRRPGRCPPTPCARLGRHAPGGTQLGEAVLPGGHAPRDRLTTGGAGLVEEVGKEGAQSRDPCLSGSKLKTAFDFLALAVVVQPRAPPTPWDGQLPSHGADALVVVTWSKGSTATPRFRVAPAPKPNATTPPPNNKRL